MDLTGKLQTEDLPLAIVNAPKGFAWQGPTAKDPKSARAVLVFMRNADELRVYSAPLVAAARRDAIAYLAYPKAGQLGTDLNRDNILVMLHEQGIRPVRSVAIDEVWSALRFRPADEE